MLHERHVLLWVALLAFLVCGTFSAKAATMTWIATSGDWSDPANWGGALPTSADGASIANDRTATVSQPGEVCGNLSLGASGAGQSGTIVMTDGSLSTANQYVGCDGTGVFEHSGGNNGTVPISPQTMLYVGYDAGATGTYNLNGSGQVSVYQEVVGYSGSGTFNQNSGINNIAEGKNQGGFHLGMNQGSIGTYNLSGSGQLSCKIERIGIGGVGILNQSSGTNTGDRLWLGLSTGSSGTYNLTGGTLITNDISKGEGTATFNFGGGTLQANATFSTTLDMTLTGIGGDAKIDTASYDVTLGGQLSGAGGLNKLGAGKLYLTGYNSYTGSKTISAGTLVVNQRTEWSPDTGMVTVNSSGTLSGWGSIYGAVIVNDGGTLAPGNNLGTLRIYNQVTFQPGSTFSAEVNGLTAGTKYDQLTTSGPVVLNGALSLSFGSFAPSGNDYLFLINNTGGKAITGMFQYADDEKIGTFNGYDWFITYDANNASTPSLDGGNDVAIYSIVPEPSQIVLLIFAVGCFLFRWRKRENRR
jgi:fibronectin-binding autotransporter adhesin